MERVKFTSGVPCYTLLSFLYSSNRGSGVQGFRGVGRGRYEFSIFNFREDES